MPNNSSKCKTHLFLSIFGWETLSRLNPGSKGCPNFKPSDKCQWTHFIQIWHERSAFQSVGRSTVNNDSGLYKLHYFLFFFPFFLFFLLSIFMLRRSNEAYRTGNVGLSSKENKTWYRTSAEAYWSTYVGLVFIDGVLGSKNLCSKSWRERPRA